MKPPKNYKLEIYHDILARKIYDRASREDKLRLQIERLVRDKYNFYQSGQGGLMTKEELSLVHTYQDSLSLPDVYQPYLRESEKVIKREEQKEIRKLRYLLLAALAVALAIGLLAIWALDQKKQAKASEAFAEEKGAEERQARLRVDSLYRELDVAYRDGQLAKTESDSNARRAEKNAQIALANESQARRAERAEAAERERAVRKSIAYRLLGLAVEQRLEGQLKTAFQIASRAEDISADSALTQFRFETYNELPASEKIINRLSLQEETTTAIISPSGKYVLVLSGTPVKALIWNLADNTTEVLPGDNVLNAQFLSDENYLTAEKEAFKVWRIGQQTPERVMVNSKRLTKAYFSPDVKHWAGLSQDNTVRLFSDTGRLLSEIPQGNSVRNLVFRPGKEEFVTISYRDGIRLWSYDGALLNTFSTDKWPYDAIFSPDGGQLLVSTIANELWLWNLEKPTTPKSMQHKAPINAIAFSAEGQYILSASNDETARIWDRNGQLKKTFYHGAHPDLSIFVKKAIFSKDEKYVITLTEGTDGSRNIFYWNTKGQQLARYAISDDLAALQFADDGRSFLAATTAGEITTRKTFSSHVETFPKVSLIDIDELGYEMDFNYWLSNENPNELLQFANHFNNKSDNFKRPEEQIMVLSKAAKLYEAALLKKPLTSFSEEERWDVNQVYGNLSWYQLLNSQFRAAERSARRAYEVFPEKEWVKTNLVLAYVLTNRFARARPIYEQLKDLRIDLEETDTRTFREVFLYDLDHLEEEGISHPDFARVRSLLEEWIPPNWREEGWKGGILQRPGVLVLAIFQIVCSRGTMSRCCLPNLCFLNKLLRCFDKIRGNAKRTRSRTRLRRITLNLNLFLNLLEMERPLLYLRILVCPLNLRGY